MLALLFLLAVRAQVDDENPDFSNFCVLDADGNPVNCNVDDDLSHDDGLVRSTMNCSGVDKGPLLTTCEFHNICYVAHQRPYETVKEHEVHLKPNEVPSYVGVQDWLFYSDAADVSVPPLELMAHRSKNIFGANVTKPALQSDKVKWLDGTTVLIYRQYLVNYYHVVMDDMIGIWWTMQNYAPNTPRDMQFLFLDDHSDTLVDTETMMGALTTKPLLFRRQLHEMNEIVCVRRALVGQAERSWGGPGRRFITPPLLRQFHNFLRTGAYDLLERKLASRDTAKTTAVERARACVLFRVGSRLILNEPEVMEGLRSAFPDVDFYELRTEKMSFLEQVQLMKNTTLLISVHGAGLTNLLFMPSGAAVVEILPWHWERHAYGRLCELLDYVYFAWRNTNREATRFHESTFDGFPTVSEADKHIIRTADSKPMEMRAPGALAAEKYWINQDTIVNVPEFVEVVGKALALGLNKRLRAVRHNEL